MMPKKICVHCQEKPGNTRDHVLPDAWYPTTTPPTVQRLTVPACLPCNTRLHRAEDAIGLDLVLICKSDLPEIKGVPEKVYRAWNAEYGRNVTDAIHRAGKVRRILRTMEWPEPVA